MVDYLVYSWDDEMVESMVEGTVEAMEKCRWGVCSWVVEMVVEWVDLYG